MLPVRWQGQAPPSIRGTWCYICLLIDLYNREIVGHDAGARKDSNLVKAAFATVAFPLFDIDVFHSDRGSEFDNAALDELFEVFGITRSLSKKGCPYDNAVDESANKTLKAEFVHGKQLDARERGVPARFRRAGAEMPVGRGKVGHGKDAFVRFPSQSYATIQEELTKAMAQRQVGRNGWPVIVALC